MFGNDAKDTNIPAEVWRYYLLTNRPEVNAVNLICCFPHLITSQISLISFCLWVIENTHGLHESGVGHIVYMGRLADQTK